MLVVLRLQCDESFDHKMFGNQIKLQGLWLIEVHEHRHFYCYKYDDDRDFDLVEAVDTGNNVD